MSRRALLVVRAALLIATTQLAFAVPAASDSIDFIIGGSTGEPKAFLRDGVPLWAILPDGDGFRLARRTAQVRTFEYRNPARGDEAFVGQRLVGKDADLALMHLAGPIRLREGRIRLGARDRTLIDYSFGSEKTASSPVTFELDDRVFRVVAEVGPSVGGYKSLRVFLEDGPRRQELVSSLEATDPYARLAWIGDIDRDGLPDLLLSVRFHHSAISHRLFLSSFADAGQLCGHAGTLDQDGD